MKLLTMLHGKKAAQNSEQAAKEAFSGNSLVLIYQQLRLNQKNLINRSIL